LNKKLLIVLIVMFFMLPLLGRADNNNSLIMGFSQGVDVDGEGVPFGWELKEKEGVPVFKLEEEGDSQVLHLVSESSSFGFVKQVDLNIKEYPYLNFKWKIKELPRNGDFRKKETDDQAAQIYVVFGKFKLTAEIVGYLWENKAPKLITGTSPSWGKARLIVLESGLEKIDRWVQEKRNVYEDYKALFDKDPPKANVISRYINSQHTKSRAESYFDEIYFSKE
jgi:hypothetical protein